jgi:hypothetical protein
MIIKMMIQSPKLKMYHMIIEVRPIIMRTLILIIRNHSKLALNKLKNFPDRISQISTVTTSPPNKTNMNRTRKNSFEKSERGFKNVRPNVNVKRIRINNKAKNLVMTVLVKKNKILMMFKSNKEAKWKEWSGKPIALKKHYQ